MIFRMPSLWVPSYAKQPYSSIPILIIYVCPNQKNDDTERDIVNFLSSLGFQKTGPSIQDLDTEAVQIETTIRERLASWSIGDKHQFKVRMAWDKMNTAEQELQVSILAKRMEQEGFFFDTSWTRKEVAS